MKNKIISFLILGGMIFAPALSIAQDSDHGTSTKLGSLSMAGYNLVVTKLGEVKAGKEAAFLLESGDSNAKAITALNAYLWVEDQAGSQVSAPAKGSVEGKSLHFHLTPKAGSEPKRVVVRVRAEGKDEKASLPLDGHGHEHVSTPHDGVLAALKDDAGTQIGYIELKLHDDKGDLELWLAKDKKISEPIDLPLGTKVQVAFVDVNNRVVDLQPRDTKKNEDENGVVNIRGTSTNYFIYPVTKQEDSSWLTGAAFQSIVQVSYTVNGKRFVSDEFMLVPHVHSGGGHH